MKAREIVFVAGEKFIPYERDGYAVLDTRTLTVFPSSKPLRKPHFITVYHIPKNIADLEEFPFLTEEERKKADRAGLTDVQYALEAYGEEYVKDIILYALAGSEEKAETAAFREGRIPPVADALFRTLYNRMKKERKEYFDSTRIETDIPLAV